MSATVRVRDIRPPRRALVRGPLGRTPQGGEVVRVRTIRPPPRGSQGAPARPRRPPSRPGPDALAQGLRGRVPEAPGVTVDRDRLEADVCASSLVDFVRRFWEAVPGLGPLVWNWHLDVFCGELQSAAERVFAGLPKLHDYVVNVPPGTTKSLIFSVLFPAWVWTRMPSARTICGSYTEKLALDLGRKSRQVVRSEKYRRLYPGVELARDQDAKSYFSNTLGGARIACSADGLITGFHAHFIVVDDPVDPRAASSMSAADLRASVRWVSETLPSRKIDKKVTVTFLVMQRLHQDDPSAAVLKRRDQGLAVRHIRLPAEVEGSGLDVVRPRGLAANYVGGLLDPVRLDRGTLRAALAELGQFGYAGQFLQNPVPLGGGMFRVDRLGLLPAAPRPGDMTRVVRYWDKAGTRGGGAYTAGVKVGLCRDGRVVVLDVVRGQWDSASRERTIELTARVDGAARCEVAVEQEPGSGGKESAEATVRRLRGFRVRVDRPRGDKVLRADPLSVQVNSGNVWLVEGPWNRAFLDEIGHFPLSRYKDQVDAASGAFAVLTNRRTRVGGMWRSDK